MEANLFAVLSLLLVVGQCTGEQNLQTIIILLYLCPRFMQVVHACQWHTLVTNNIFSPTATAISRSERSAESTPTSTLQTTINSTLCGDVRLLLQQQGKDGRDGRDGPQGKQGPRDQPDLLV